MDLSGNSELLDRELVAFFASRNSLPEALHLAQAWANEISLTDKIVISGFHSPIERAVLDILLNKGNSVIVALGRGLYHRIPPHLSSAYKEQRVLFVSFRKHKRPSFNNSQLRNWAVSDLANEIVFAPFPKSSQLSSLYYFLAHRNSLITVLK